MLRLTVKSALRKISSFQRNSSSKKETSLVNVHNEWDPLEEIIVGTAKFANFPSISGDPFFEAGYGDDGEDRTGLVLPHRISKRMIEETEEDLEQFVTDLKKLNIIVKRPEPIDFKGKIKTMDWEVEPFFCYCPRDLHLTIGETIIEAPSPMRSRYLEYFSYHKLMYEYLDSGARWISAPKQRLQDSAFDLTRKSGPTMLTETEMMFDAANILRIGKDIIYLVSDSGNERGAKWLQSTLGSEYTVHPCRDMYYGIHIDTSMVVLRPGLVLLRPDIKRDVLPLKMQKWDIIYSPPMVAVNYPQDAPGKTVIFGFSLFIKLISNNRFSSSVPVHDF